MEETDDKRVVVYMGDDERFEYIYRYVSNQPWRKAFRDGRHPLDDGILFVARFNADGSGDWLPLTTDNPALAGLRQPGGHPHRRPRGRRRGRAPRRWIVPSGST